MNIFIIDDKVIKCKSIPLQMMHEARFVVNVNTKRILKNRDSRDNCVLDLYRMMAERNKYVLKNGDLVLTKYKNIEELVVLI